MTAMLIVDEVGCTCNNCGSVIYGVPIDKIKFCYHCGAKFTKVKRVLSTLRDLTDEEQEIYDSWLEHDSIHTGMNIFDDLKGSDDID